MKISKKIFACVLTVCMLLTMFAGVLSANAAVAGTATIGTLEDVVAAGAEATVPVTLTADAAIGGADLYIAFPEDVTVSAAVATEGYTLEYLVAGEMAAEGNADLVDGVAHFVLLANDDAFAGATTVEIALTIAGAAEGENVVAFADGTLIGTTSEVAVAAELVDGGFTVVAEAVCDHAETTTTEEVTKEATCAEAGSKTVTVTCNACSEVISQETVEIPATGEHNYVDGACDVCGAPYGDPVEDTNLKFASASVGYGTSSLEMTFRLMKTVVALYDEITVVIIPQKYDTTTFNLADPVEIPLTTADLVDKGSFYQYVYSDIQLYELGLDIEYMIKAYDENGNYVAYAEYSTSPATFLKEMYPKVSADTKLRTLIVDTLVVGDEAAKSFGKAGSDLANATSIIEGFDLSEATQSIGTPNTVDSHEAVNADFGTASTCAHRVIKSVAIGKVPYINYRIMGASSLDLSKLSINVAYSQTTGVGTTTDYNRTFTSADAELTANATVVTLKFEEVGLADAGKDLTITVNYDGAVVATTVYSIETFLNGMTSNATTGDLCTALLKLSASAANKLG